MLHYLLKGLDVPVNVDTFSIGELGLVKELLVQLEIYDDPVKRRLIIHKIGLNLRTMGKISPQARVAGISIGFLANGEKRVFLATYERKGIDDINSYPH